MSWQESDRGTRPRGVLDVERLFRPRAVAVVGASETPGSVGREVVENLIHHGFEGAIYPVNPKYARILGLPCFGDLKQLPRVPDVLALALPAAATAAVIEQAGACGIGFAIVYASGFGETGPQGTALQQALKHTARRAGVRLIGPNCQGLMNVAERIHIGFGPPYRLTYPPGRVSVVSQSGAFGNSLLMGLSAEGVGIRHYISTGNEADTSALDLIEAMLEDSETAVIASYIEGLSDAFRLRGLAHRAALRGVPLVLWKVGRSEAGARAAASHTANLAGDDRLYRAAFSQLGIVDADDIGDMADSVRALLSGRRAEGPRVGIITISGGAGVAMADRADTLGLSLAHFDDATMALLRERLPAFASVANPLDVTAGAVADPDGLAAALEAVAVDRGVDMLALAFAAVSGRAALAIAQAVTRLAESTPMAIVIAWNAPRAGNEKAYAMIEAMNLPVYASPGRAIRGLAAVHHASGPRTIEPEGACLAPAHHEHDETVLLNEIESRAHLAGTGIAQPEEAVAMTRAEAGEAARCIGFPVVLKLLSSALAHKSDIGGVRLNLRSRSQVEAAFATLAGIPTRLQPAVAFEGVIVQSQISDAIEVILGARVDASFGPIVVFGAGGVYAELLSDVSIRLAPIDRDGALAMIGQTRIARILRGFRGRQGGDIMALANAVARLSDRIAQPNGPLREIEINPLFVLRTGGGVIAGDCVARVSAGRQH